MTDINISSTITTNLTTPSNQQKYFYTSRIIPNVIVSCLLSVTLWITISLIHYGIKTEKWRQSKKQSQADILNIGRIYTSVVLCGVIVTFYVVVALVYMNTGFANDGYNVDAYCNSISDLVYSAFTLTMFSTVTFLWLRQRTFFQNKLLNIHYSKCMKVFSSLSLFVVMSAGIGTLILIAHPYDHIATKDGCVYNSNGILKKAYGISFVTVAIIYQSLFLGLFVYATKMTHALKNNVRVDEESNRNDQQALRRSTAGKKSNNDKRNITPVSRQAGNQTFIAKHKRSDFRKQKTATARKIRSILIKTIAVAVTTTILDLLLVLITSFVAKPHKHHGYSVMLASLNAFLHLFLTVLSFPHWRKTLTSFCRRS